MKRKTSIYNSVIVFMLLISVAYCGCQDEKITATPTSKGGEVKTHKGVFVQVRELNEFDYKGHKYISCNVRDGLALTHAGHCWCNSIKK